MDFGSVEGQVGLLSMSLNPIQHGIALYQKVKAILLEGQGQWSSGKSMFLQFSKLLVAAFWRVEIMLFSCYKQIHIPKNIHFKMQVNPVKYPISLKTTVKDNEF